jgi:hypothetical protein
VRCPIIFDLDCNRGASAQQRSLRLHPPFIRRDPAAAEASSTDGSA